MNIIRFVPFIFVFLWSTGFVGAKFGLPYAEPFTFLMWRMAFVLPIFTGLVLLLKCPTLSTFDAVIQLLIGLLIHGFYLGGVFSAINVNVSSGLSALLVSLNPIVLAVFSALFLHKQLRFNEWLGLNLGLGGVLIVLYGASSWDGVVTLQGILWLLFALTGIVAGTVLQKRYAQQVDLVWGLTYQYIGALVFFTVLSFSLETGTIEWHTELILTMVWLVLAISVVTILLLLYMIRHGEATRVASYFYLTPPLAAVWGWLFFDEQWSWLTVIGAALIIIALILSKPRPQKA